MTCNTVAGGYVYLKAFQVTNVLQKLIAAEIEYLDLRVFFALVAMRHARRAAVQANPSPKQKNRCYRVQEIVQLVGGQEKKVRESLTRLERVGLAQVRSSSIAFSNAPFEAASLLLDEIAPKRGYARYLPVPRRVVRFLATCRKPAHAKVMVAFMLRGLGLTRTKEITYAGAVKDCLIAKVAGVSLRGAQLARQALMDAGWLTVDSKRKRHILNRVGSYFCINLNWEASVDENHDPSDVAPTLSSVEEETLLSYDCSNQQSNVCISHNSSDTTPGFSHTYQYKNLLPTEELKNQNLTLPSEQTGVFINTLRSESKELRCFSVMERVYREALDAEAIAPLSGVTWIASALYAREQEGDKELLFWQLVTNPAWELIEPYREQAQAVIERFCGRVEAFGKLRVAPRPQPPEPKAAATTIPVHQAPTEPVKPPTLRDVQIHDLEDPSRLLSLYQQAVRKGIVNEGEAEQLNFVGAAIRALTVEGDPVRVFLGIVKRRLWGNINQTQEDEARALLRDHREGRGRSHEVLSMIRSLVPGL